MSVLWATTHCLSNCKYQQSYRSRTDFINSLFSLSNLHLLSKQHLKQSFCYTISFTHNRLMTCLSSVVNLRGGSSPNKGREMKGKERSWGKRGRKGRRSGRSVIQRIRGFSTTMRYINWHYLSINLSIYYLNPVAVAAHLLPSFLHRC